MRTEQEIRDKIARLARLQEAQDSMTVSLPIHAIIMKELRWVLEDSQVKEKSDE